ncbi:hypothetical protein GYM46_08900 [Brevundimonas mediterranea]|jgi:hypothetical protein|uniref:Uncharacterized protein n=1 Tax=Brevundimonas mediterranea TaxID=74329 RepID=A0AB37E764_9CAUL|nr:hypothetical protein [Brevundimonas mediterranea]QIH73057.1 hypothetical protein GYM46_08900 [Brevundimonas mediterranea]
MGEEIDDPPDAGRGGEPSDAANARVEADPGESAMRPRLHMTGRGLSPAEYRAQHGAHPHQADVSRGAVRSGEGDGVDRRQDMARRGCWPDRP